MEVLRELVAGGEIGHVTGEAGVERVAHAVDHMGFGEEHGDGAEEQEIREHFVRHVTGG